MDNQKFGTFISKVRKEKGWTQLELAEKLNVTDKAVSKWERGVGFPDIKTLEPLAKALDVSIVELMQSERNKEKDMLPKEVSQVMLDVIDVAVYQRKIERRNIFCGIFFLMTIIMGIFLLDTMQIEGIVFVCMPLLFGTIGIWLIINSLRYRMRKSPYKAVLLFGVFFIMFPIIFGVILYFAFSFGGPVPN